MNGLKNRGKSPSIPSPVRRIYRGNLSLPASLFCFEFFWRSLFPFIPYTDGWGPVTHCGSWAFFVFRYSNDECSKEEPVKKFFRNFSGDLIFALSRDLPLEGQKPLTCSLTIEYTFNRYIPDRGRRPQPDEGAPRTSCPQGLSRKARLVAIPNHSEISACYG